MKYICGPNFANLADFAFPPNFSNIYFGIQIKDLNVNEMFEGCCIFVFGNNVYQFMESIFPTIKVPFNMIVHTSDQCYPYLRDPSSDYIKKLADTMLGSDLLLNWYTINKTLIHPKLHSIPLGIPRSVPFKNQEKPCMSWYCDNFNKHIIDSIFSSLIGDNKLIDIIRSKKDSDNFIYINYSSPNTDNPYISKYKGVRRELDIFLLTSEFKKHTELIPWEQHIRLTHNHKLALNVTGEGLDCYRLWESLLAGTIPVTFSSEIDELYEDLPVLIIKSMDQLNRPYLEKQYERIISRDDYRFEKLYMDYWRKKIKG